MGSVLLGQLYLGGFFGEGVEMAMVSDRCMRGAHAGPMGGGGLRAVEQQDWQSATEIPLGKVITLQGQTFRKQSLRGRVLAGPGSTVHIEGMNVTVNGDVLQHELPPRAGRGYQSLLEHRDGGVYKVVYEQQAGLQSQTFTVGQNALFVMGDTRSQQCLDWMGVVPFSAVRGAR